MLNDYEVWRPIPDWEGYYEVSDLGRIRSVARTVKDRNGKIIPIKGKILSQNRVGRPGSIGHLTVAFYRNSACTRVLVHRAVLAAFIGPCPPGMECCHNDGNPRNNRVENLRWDTGAANMSDRRSHGGNYQLNKTRCSRGHRLVRPNLVESKLRSRSRECKACAKTRVFRFKRKKYGLPVPEFQYESDRRYQLIMSGVGLRNLVHHDLKCAG